MTNSMLCFSNNNFLTNRLKRKTKIFLHWTLQVAAAVCIIVALIAVILRKFQENWFHFKTYHSVIGLITIILTILTMIGGIPTKYNFQLRHFIRPTHTKIIHSAMALITYVVAVITMILGLYSYWFHDYGSESMFYVCWIVLIFTMQYVVYDPVAKLVRRTSSILKEAEESDLN